MNDDWVVLLTRGKHFTNCELVRQAADVDVELYTPMLSTSRRIKHTKKRIIKKAHAFPGYLFARGDVAGLVRCPWFGGAPLIIATGMPATVTDADIGKMRLLELEWGIEATKSNTTEARFAPGDRVTIAAGLLAGRAGIVEEHAAQWVTIIIDGTDQPLRIHGGMLKIKIKENT